jgi:hypothetical protein
VVGHLPADRQGPPPGLGLAQRVDRPADGGRIEADLRRGSEVPLERVEPDLAVGEPLDEAADQLGALQALPMRPDELGRPVGRVRRPASADVGHAAEHHAAGDRAPDAVGDAEAVLDGQVNQVVRQRGGHRPAVEAVDDAVVASHEGMAAFVVGNTEEHHSHAPTILARRRRRE